MRVKEQKLRVLDGCSSDKRKGKVVFSTKSRCSADAQDFNIYFFKMPRGRMLLFPFLFRAVPSARHHVHLLPRALQVTSPGAETTNLTWTRLLAFLSSGWVPVTP